MSELIYNESLDYFPAYTELKDLRSTFIVNCIFNNFMTHTSIMLNIVTIYAIHKTSAMAKTLKTLLLSLACSDVAVGLFSQPIYTFFLVKWLQLDNLSFHTYKALSIPSHLFSTASFLGVVSVSVDRFLAVHLHLRYQELVTHRRVVVVVIGKWLCSAFFSLITLWGLAGAQEITESVIAAFGFIVTFVVYIRIYLTVRRHKNQIHSMQVQEVAHSDEIKNLIIIIKSTVSLFYVYLISLIVNLLFAFFHLLGSYSNVWLEYRFKTIFSLLNDSHIS